MATATKRRPKHIPQRTCVGCRRTSAKREFVRLVRTPEGRIEVDPSGKKAGRGAYLCPSATCWQAALSKGRLSSALKTTIEAEAKRLLLEYAQSLKTAPGSVSRP